eukprot:COSAG02_NODE_3711_length_6341_cov_4.360622_3_plen_222_part_00
MNYHADTNYVRARWQSFSLLGMFSNPLWFSFHLKGLLKMPAATIVVDSIVTNYARLLTTVVLALCMIYLFALCGLLYFFDAHTGSNVANKGYLGDADPLANEYAGGPCSNLMSCMVSYSFAGFLQQGLTYWLEEPRFPETLTDLLENDSGRILFEVMFMIVTSSFVISIITGIICDTFGELRTAQVIQSTHLFFGITACRWVAMECTAAAASYACTLDEIH